MGQQKKGKQKAAAQQQAQALAAAAAAPQQAAQAVLSPAAAAAAALAGGGVGGGGAAAGGPLPSASALQELEQKKKRLTTQLKDVERQIFDLETRYLEGCNPNANALTGYDGLRTTLGSAKPSKAQPVAAEDRIFSGSSTTAAPPRTAA